MSSSDTLPRHGGAHVARGTPVVKPLLNALELGFTAQLQRLERSKERMQRQLAANEAALHRRVWKLKAREQHDDLSDWRSKDDLRNYLTAMSLLGTKSSGGGRTFGQEKHSFFEKMSHFKETLERTRSRKKKHHSKSLANHNEHDAQQQLHDDDEEDEEATGDEAEPTDASSSSSSAAAASAAAAAAAAAASRSRPLSGVSLPAASAATSAPLSPSAFMPTHHGKALYQPRVVMSSEAAREEKEVEAELREVDARRKDEGDRRKQEALQFLQSAQNAVAAAPSPRARSSNTNNNRRMTGSVNPSGSLNAGGSDHAAPVLPRRNSITGSLLPTQRSARALEMQSEGVANQQLHAQPLDMNEPLPDRRHGEKTHHRVNDSSDDDDDDEADTLAHDASRVLGLVLSNAARFAGPPPPPQLSRATSLASLTDSQRHMMQDVRAEREARQAHSHDNDASARRPHTALPSARARPESTSRFGRSATSQLSNIHSTDASSNFSDYTPRKNIVPLNAAPDPSQLFSTADKLGSTLMSYEQVHAAAETMRAEERARIDKALLEQANAVARPDKKKRVDKPRADAPSPTLSSRASLRAATPQSPTLSASPPFSPASTINSFNNSPITPSPLSPLLSKPSQAFGMAPVLAVPSKSMQQSPIKLEKKLSEMEELKENVAEEKKADSSAPSAPLVDADGFPIATAATPPVAARLPSFRTATSTAPTTSVESTPQLSIHQAIKLQSLNSSYLRFTRQLEQMGTRTALDGTKIALDAHSLKAQKRAQLQQAKALKQQQQWQVHMLESQIQQGNE